MGQVNRPQGINSTEAGQPLIDRMRMAGRSPLRKYQEVFVGDTSIASLLKYEALVAWAAVIPGGLGYFLRRRSASWLFRDVGSSIFLGQHLTIRCPGRISIGNNVIIDDNVVLDAKGDARLSAIRLGSDVLIGRNCILSGTDARIDFGDYVSVGPGCVFSTKNFIRVGSCVSIGPNVQVIAGSHAIDDPHTPAIRQPRLSEGIVLEDGVFIGTGAIIQDGVTVGTGAVIGAGAVVAEDIPPNVVAVGIPARVVKTRE